MRKDGIKTVDYTPGQNIYKLLDSLKEDEIRRPYKTVIYVNEKTFPIWNEILKQEGNKLFK